VDLDNETIVDKEDQQEEKEADLDDEENAS